MMQHESIKLKRVVRLGRSVYCFGLVLIQRVKKFEGSLKSCPTSRYNPFGELFFFTNCNAKCQKTLFVSIVAPI